MVFYILAYRNPMSLVQSSVLLYQSMESVYFKKTFLQLDVSISFFALHSENVTDNILSVSMKEHLQIQQCLLAFVVLKYKLKFVTRRREWKLDIRGFHK